MHAKTDSEVTSSSIAPSSPSRPVYYVHSPSHDGEKTATSFHSTPALSPTASPPHSHSSDGRHSRHSSSTRFSGSLKPGSRKISPNDGSRGGGKRKGGAGDGMQWKDFDVIEEEGLLDDGDRQRGLPRRCYFLVFVLGFLFLFFFFALILWGASKSQKPRITMKSITFQQLQIQAGSDSTGVATDMITVNSTVKLLYRNTGSFFGIHVMPSPVDLSFSQLTIASGSINKFYQRRKSQRLVSVDVTGDQIPLYGSGAGLSTTSDMPSVPVPLRLSFVIRSRAYVLGKLVKPKFDKKIDCSVTFDPKKINVAMSLDKSCTYD